MCHQNATPGNADRPNLCFWCRGRNSADHVMEIGTLTLWSESEGTLWRELASGFMCMCEKVSRLYIDDRRNLIIPLSKPHGHPWQAQASSSNACRARKWQTCPLKGYDVCLTCYAPQETGQHTPKSLPSVPNCRPPNRQLFAPKTISRSAVFCAELHGPPPTRRKILNCSLSGCPNSSQPGAQLPTLWRQIGQMLFT